MLASFGVVSYGSVSRSSSVLKLIQSVLPRFCTLPPTCRHHAPRAQNELRCCFCKLEPTRGSMFCTVQVPIPVHAQTPVLAHARHNTRAHITRTDATQCMGAKKNDALAKGGTITHARTLLHAHVHANTSTYTDATVCRRTHALRVTQRQPNERVDASDTEHSGCECECGTRPHTSTVACQLALTALGPDEPWQDRRRR